MEDIILTQLRELGFSDKESKVYLATFKLGSSPIQKISKLSGVNRATTYVVVEALMKLGLMSSYTKGKKRLFTVEPPERLSSLIVDDKATLMSKEKAIEDLIPSLGKIYQMTQGGEKPQVRFYEGKAGLNTVREEMLKTKEKQIYGIFNLDSAQEVFTDEENDAFYSKRISRKIGVHLVYTSEKGDILKDSTKKGVLYRYITDTSKYTAPIDISAFDDSIAITSFGNPLMSVIIQNNDIAQAMKQLIAIVEETSSK